MVYEGVLIGARPTLTGIPSELREKIFEYLVDGVGTSIKAAGPICTMNLALGVDQQTRDIIATCRNFRRDVEHISIKLRCYKVDFVSDTRRFLSQYEYLKMIRNIELGPNPCTSDETNLERLMGILSSKLPSLEKIIVQDFHDEFLDKTGSTTLTKKAQTVLNVFENQKKSSICHHVYICSEAAQDTVTLDRLIFTVGDAEKIRQACEDDFNFIKIYHSWYHRKTCLTGKCSHYHKQLAAHGRFFTNDFRPLRDKDSEPAVRDDI